MGVSLPPSRRDSRCGPRRDRGLHSSVEALRPHFPDSPLHVVADPDKQLYRRFGVEVSPRALLDPRAWGAMTRGLATAPAWSLRAEGGRLGLPADFLVAPDGRVWACNYGRHADDQWSVDELLALARAPGAQPDQHQ